MLLKILFLLVIVYMGVAFGFLMITYNVPSLKPCRKIYLYMPYITFFLTIYISADLIRERRFVHVIQLLFMGNKMMLIGLCMVKVAREVVATHPNKNIVQVINCFKFINRVAFKGVANEYSRYANKCVA